MKKAWGIIAIAIIIITLAVAEQIVFGNIINSSIEESNAIILQLESDDPFNDNSLELKTEEFKKNWKHREDILCTFTNHKDIQSVGESIEKLIVSINFKNLFECKQYASVISFQLKNYTHMVGTNIQNIF